MFLYLIILLFVLQINCTSLCGNHNSGCLCNFFYLNNENAYKAEKIQTKYVRCDVSDVKNIFGNISREDVNILDLSQNKISELPTNNLISETITDLYLNKNNIEEITSPSLQLPKLKRLDLSDNLLQYIDRRVFKGVVNLKYLNLANNRFTHFQQRTFTHLRYLNEIILDNNNIGDQWKGYYELSEYLESISLSGTNLTRIPYFIYSVYNLRKLTISKNGISDVKYSFSLNLRYLDISDNPLSVIFDKLHYTTELQVLKLNNLLIKNVPSHAFANHRYLKVLELEGNGKLNEFDSMAFGVSKNWSEFRLEWLSLKGSNLSTLNKMLLEPFRRVSVLDLQGNPWTCDCNIIWIKDLQIPKYYHDDLTCAFPARLYQYRIYDLKNNCMQRSDLTGFWIATGSLMWGLCLITLFAVVKCILRLREHLN